MSATIDAVQILKQIQDEQAAIIKAEEEARKHEEEDAKHYAAQQDRKATMVLQPIESALHALFSAHKCVINKARPGDLWVAVYKSTEEDILCLFIGDVHDIYMKLTPMLALSGRNYVTKQFSMGAGDEIVRAILEHLVIVQHMNVYGP